MGLIRPRLFTSTPFFFLVPALLGAAPMLRLSNTVVGPVSVAQGAAGPAQELEAFNAGDGALNLSFTSTAGWASASAGALRNCSTREGQCIPIRVALATQSLAAGAHTATITVRDPNTVDAPQNILVTVQVGGGIPSRLDLYAAPNGSADQAIFHTNSPIGSDIGTQSGGPWLSLALDGLGSFRFALPYRVTARHLSGMAEGTYSGSIAVKDSRFSPDNKTVQVSLRVTSQPIVSVNPQSLRFRIAENTRPQAQFVAISNRGLGTLTVSGVTAATGSGGNWLTAERLSGFDLVSVTANAAGLAAGLHRGTVSVASNGVNSPLSVAVELEVVPQSSPALAFQGVVNNATFEPGEPLAQGGIAAIFGEQLSYSGTQQADSLPLGAELGGARVFVNDRPAPVYFTSYGQINFQVPYDTPPGDALVRVDRESQRGNSVSVRILPSVPRILRLRGDYAIAVNSDGTFAIPRSLGIPNSRPARVGEAIVLYALALGPTSPPAASGAAAPAAEPLARVNSAIARVLFGATGISAGVPADALYAGLTPNFVGLYQVNVVVPEGAPSGDVPIRLQLDAASSTSVLMAVE